MARMVRAKSSKALEVEERKAGGNYRAQLVSAARSLELHPKDQRAATLLRTLIPKDDEQQTTWMTLDDSLRGAEPFSDMKSLARLRDWLPRDWAKAVLLVPGQSAGLRCLCFDLNPRPTQRLCGIHADGLPRQAR